MEQNAPHLVLNLGCGPRKVTGCLNVDINPEFAPDVLMDLTCYPWPWENAAGIVCSHTLEHIEDWMKFFEECVRVTRPGGFIQITVPDWADIDSTTVRSHLHVFSLQSFKNRVYGITDPYLQGREPDYSKFLPVMLTGYYRIVHKDKVKWWIPKRVLRWLMDHCIGYCLEQRFDFVKL